LRALYWQIHQCTTCHSSVGCNIRPDPHRILRVAIPDTLESRIFLVGQALAKDTQRLSGIPYTLPSGKTKAAGTKLNTCLTYIDYCIPHVGNENRQMVYSSDIVQCWPGSRGSRDTKPRDLEINNCFHWLLSEIDLVKPRVIILLGKIAASIFIQRYLAQEVKQLSTVLDQEYTPVINGAQVYLYVLPHPTSGYPGFYTIYKHTLGLAKEHL